MVYSTGCKADDPDGGSCALLCPDPDGTAIASALAQCSASVVVTGTVTSNELGLADARCAKRLSLFLSPRAFPEVLVTLTKTEPRRTAILESRGNCTQGVRLPRDKTGFFGVFPMFVPSLSW